MCWRSYPTVKIKCLFSGNRLCVRQGPAADCARHHDGLGGGLPGAGGIFPDSAAGGEDGTAVRELDGDVLVGGGDVGHDELDALGSRTAGERRVVARRQRARHGRLRQTAHVVRSSAAHGRGRGRRGVRQGRHVRGTADEAGQAGGAAVGAAGQHGLVATVEPGEIAPCIGRGQGGRRCGAARQYYRLPFGGVKICLGIMHVARYPDNRDWVAGGDPGRRHGSNYCARRQRRRCGRCGGHGGRHGGHGG